MNSKYRAISLFLLLTAIASLIGLTVAEKVIAGSESTYEKLSVFTDVLGLVENNYVDEISTEDLIYGAIRGMVGSLDPHSSFLNAQAYNEMQVDTKGQFGGLGIEITIRDGWLTVVAPIEDTPAFNVGIKASDKIVAIEGESTKDMSLMDAVSKMRGPRGSEITISVMREGFDKPKDFVIIRDIIKIRSVRDDQMLDEHYGYVRVSQFQEKTSADLKRVIDKFINTPGGLKGFILDLRNDPGGLLDQAIAVSDLFIDQGLIVYTQGRNPSQKAEFFSTDEGYNYDFNMIILVNGGSASASEIVSGALQDHGRALIVGEQSFGKGSVQTIIRLKDGSGLRLTTARYYTPSGRSIQDTGITPDVVVNQVIPDAAIEEAAAKEEAEDEAASEDDKKKEKRHRKVISRIPKDHSEDAQLKYALDLLKSFDRFQNMLDKKAPIKDGVTAEAVTETK